MKTIPGCETYQILNELVVNEGERNIQMYTMPNKHYLYIYIVYAH